MTLKIIAMSSVMWLISLYSCSFGPAPEQIKNAIESELKKSIPRDALMNSRILDLRYDYSPVGFKATKIASIDIVELEDKKENTNYYPARVYVKGWYEGTIVSFGYDVNGIGTTIKERKTGLFNMECNFNLFQDENKRWRAEPTLLFEWKKQEHIDRF